MTEPTTARPQIDPTLKALVDAIPMTFKASDGVEVARAKLKQLQAPPEMLPDLRIENRIVGHGDVTDIPVRIYWPSAEPEQPAGRRLLPRRRFRPRRPRHPRPGGPRARRRRGGHRGVRRLPARPGTPVPGRRGRLLGRAAMGRRARRRAGRRPEPDCRRRRLGRRQPGRGDGALRARDEGGPQLAFQLLWYPSITADLSLPSFTENADAPILDGDVIDAFLQLVHPGRRHQRPKALPPTLAPSNAEDFSGLAPAFIGSAEHDPLRDDAALYAGLLNDAGVPAELSNESDPGTRLCQLRADGPGRCRGNQPRSCRPESGTALIIHLGTRYRRYRLTGCSGSRGRYR